MTPQRDQTDTLPMSLFDYELPDDLIAQEPLEDRTASRLLVLDRSSGETVHSRFREIGAWLREGDLLVLNDTRVIPARLMARRETGGRVEFLLLEERSGDNWHAMARPAGRLAAGERLTLLDSQDDSTDRYVWIRERAPDGTLLVNLPDSSEVLQRLGRVPLPHYIKETLHDPDRYQTVYATDPGSVAAPTAGMHFTEELLSELRACGVEIATVTLHVGPGTFQPVKTDDALKHTLHDERFSVSDKARRQIASARVEGRRVIAVGTTSCRTLEAIADLLETVGPIEGRTSLYITPGYRFQVISGLLTNFHLPRSTLLLLVSAFAGRESVLRAYGEAVARGYRFYSFGDAMLIV